MGENEIAGGEEASREGVLRRDGFAGFGFGPGRAGAGFGVCGYRGGLLFAIRIWGGRAEFVRGRRMLLILRGISAKDFRNGKAAQPRVLCGVQDPASVS
jgi:hypothetical protein